MLQTIFKPVLARNEQFKGLHEGETCFILGNGASLKNMELSSFSEHVSIGVNLLCLHNEFRSLNIKYSTVVEPFFFYPYIKNPYIKKYQPNILGQLFKKAISQYPDVKIFTSISNILGSNVENVFYLHHFGHRQPDNKFCDISGAFSFMAGGLYSAIGLAIGMGFNKAVLVGCDYMFTPICNGHFYAAGPPTRSDSEANVYEKLLAEIDGVIELSVVTDIGGSKWLPYQTYEELTGNKIKYQENTEIINKEYLDMLSRALELKQYGSPIYTTT